MSRPRNGAWHGAVTMLALAFCSLAYLAHMEFGRLRDQPLSADELFFSACAARGLAVGQIPVAGCHDNKGPVIYAVHQLAQLASSAYDFPALKIAAFAIVLLLASAAGLLAYRLSGGTASVATMALLLQALATDASFLALKTETVGALPLVLGLIMVIDLNRGGAKRGSGDLAIAGALMGLALLARQTYALVAIVTAVWLVRPVPGHGATGFRASTGKLIAFGVGLMTPLFLLLLFFYIQEHQVEYLAELFVYPLVRSVPTNVPPVHAFFRSVAYVLATLATTPLLCLAFSIGGAGVIFKTTAGDTGKFGIANARLLLLISALAMLLVIFVSPSYFPFHVIPVQVLMAVSGGVAIAEFGSESVDSIPNRPVYITVAIAVSSLLMVATSWKENGGNTGAAAAYQEDGLPKKTRGAYAYVLGARPQFYTSNGFVPASNLMFPWAMEGLPPTYFYQPPPVDSLRGRLLAWVQSSNQGQLLADFRRTPPLYIVIVHSMARAKDSKRLADVPGVDEYLHADCVYERELKAEEGKEASLFKCNTRGR